nr:PREDICTED: ankyrin and armadillo repeat-containing protein-like [Latimeria chalumnae]|eukprot:XP_014348786.1 PREDICTED: ankyrin and armadillo repeat-containing protein-like [Latimeria chalumnae]
MTYSQSEVIQVEAAWAVAAAVLGNRENMELLYENSVFNYMHILQLLYSSKEGVCLLASGALATFAFNNLRQQEEIVQSGGIRWHNLQPFLGSKNEIYRVNAAFQCIVLCRTIPDNEPANTTATGIKTIVDVLEQSHSKDALALAADCLARLAHTRAGIPAAIASLNAIGRLCNLLSCPAEQVRGCAAIALGYLSFNHQAERQLLKRCRKEHHLVKILLYYTRTYKLSPTFLERWKHLKELSLPPIRRK